MTGKWWSRIIQLALGGSGVVSLVAGAFFTYRTQYEQPQYRYLPADQEWRDHLKDVVELSRQKVEQASASPWLVDVSGAVARPGLYSLKPGARVQEAILAAGGFANEVDQQFVHQQLNLADTVRDRTKIYIPYLGETTPPVNSMIAPKELTIAVNSAPAAELEALAGIGEKRAEEIIANRPYRDESDFRERAGLSSAIIDSLLGSGWRLIY